MTSTDHQARVSFLQQMMVDDLANDAGNDVFLKLVQSSMSDVERDMVASVHFAIDAELTCEQASILHGALGEEAFILEAIVLRFIRSYRRPPIVRGDIAAVARRVDSLAKKALEISSEIKVLDEALHDMTCAGINLVAFGALESAHEVDIAIKDLRAAIARLSDARDTGLAATGRRSNLARRRFVRELLALLQGLDQELIANIVAGAVEAVEGRVGAGEREWVQPLISTALLAEEPDHET